mmetsp:Transcript_21154/g.45248  ORF Transcript_21154/g.45248 Transcript_21154/m.45248 type:complete len:213 (-) Transcript_21154:217-855(-)
MGRRDRQGVRRVVRHGRRRPHGNTQVRRRTRVRQHGVTRPENGRGDLRHRAQPGGDDHGRAQGDRRGGEGEGTRPFGPRRRLQRHDGMRILQAVGDGKVRRHGLRAAGVRRRSGSGGRQGGRGVHRDAPRETHGEYRDDQPRGGEDVGAHRGRSEVHCRWLGGGKVWIGRSQVSAGVRGDRGNAGRAQEGQAHHSLKFVDDNRGSQTFLWCF